MENFRSDANELFAKVYADANIAEQSSERIPFTTHNAIERAVQNTGFVNNLLGDDLQYVFGLLRNHYLRRNTKGVIWWPPFLNTLSYTFSRKTVPHIAITSQPIVQIWNNQIAPEQFSDVNQQTLEELYTEKPYVALIKSFSKKTYPELLNHIGKELDKVIPKIDK